MVKSILRLAFKTPALHRHVQYMLLPLDPKGNLYMLLPRNRRQSMLAHANLFVSMVLRRRYQTTVLRIIKALNQVTLSWKRPAS
jgi:hypothetical protein